MKKSLLMWLLVFGTAISLSSCSDDENNEENYPSIIGSWSDSYESTGEYVSFSTELIWTFNSNHTASQRFIIRINGVISKETISKWTYVYKGNTIIIKNESGTTIEYEISVSGNKMKLGNKEDGYWDLTKIE